MSGGCKFALPDPPPQVSHIPPYPVAGFEGLLRGEGKGRKGGEMERKERDGGDGRKTPSPQVNLWLRPWINAS